MVKRCGLLSALLGLGCTLALPATADPQPGHVLDEAKSVQRDAASLGGAADDYFHAMDGGIDLSPDEAKGRNTWIVWTGGNDRMWDALTISTFGGLDFLKTLSDHPALAHSRDDRWHYYGLVNEPCFQKATAPDPDKWVAGQARGGPWMPA
jgi:hypothetical protein